MIRRDYILRMIEEFLRVLTRINSLKQEGLWNQAEGRIEEEAKRLAGSDLATICTLTDTEVLARLLQTGEFQALREKAFMLARLLAEAADLADAQAAGAKNLDSRTLRLKALHLLLNTILRVEVYEWPAFVPTIDLLLSRLENTPLPLHTRALLMQHFERSGQFAKAEDALFAMLELAPDDPVLRQLGLSFCQRLLAQTDAALAEGGLPREEVQASLDEIRAQPLEPES